MPTKQEDILLEQYKRKNILVVKKKDYEVCLQEGIGSELQQDDNVAILKLPIQKEDKSSKFLSFLENEGLLVPGNILVQSPFDQDTYVVATSALQTFSLDKHMYFSELCQNLGAKELTVNEINMKNTTGELTLDLSARVPSRGGIKGNMEFKDLEDFKSKMELKDLFEGGNPNINEAKKLLSLYRLNSDSQMKGLVQARSNKNNSLKARTLKINLSQEVKKNLSIAAQLKIPNIFNIDASFKTQVDEKAEYFLDVTVLF